MHLQCGPCKGRHKVNATEMAIIIEMMMAGDGHTVSLVRQRGSRRKHIEINPVCIATLIPTVAKRDAA